MDFISSLSHVKLNIVFLILVLPIIYQKYAKRWSACTGKYFTEGKVIWSSYDYTGSHSSNEKVAIINFHYWIDGELFHSHYYCPKNSGDHFVKKYPAGSMIPVFYSIKSPSYCVIDKPPSSFQILSDSVGTYMVPIFIIANAGLGILHLL